MVTNLAHRPPSILFKLSTAARLAGLPFVPVTPTFPALGPLGLVPLPSKWSIRFGDPIALDHLGREAASDELLVTGLGWGAGRRVSVWSLPGGAKLRTIDFGAPSFWQVGPGRLFAESPEGAPRGSFVGGGLLRSWRLPDGDPEALGRVDGEALGITSSAFEPHGRGWLYTKGATTHLIPLPVGQEGARLPAAGDWLEGHPEG